MSATSSPRYWIVRFAIGLSMLVLAGLLPRVLRFRDPLGVLPLSLGFYGFYIALTAVGPMVRSFAYLAHTRKAWSEAAHEAFARASLPRRIFYLLVAVAEADGPMSAVERELVRQFLLRRFVDPVDAHEIRTWETQPLQVEDRVGLAARIAKGLDQGELDTLFCWCALVAFADGRFRPNEHTALHDVARGLGIPAQRARMLFHLARAQFLGGRRGADFGGDDRQRRQGRTAGAVDARTEALAVLGLAIDASPEQIRRRHRELVRKFHPDAQPNLGPVAQKEATERFTAIQRAYETLTA